MHPNELRHLQLQAAIRDHNIPKSELKYIGKIVNEHMYLIDGQHIVGVSQITEFEEVTDG